MADLRCRAPLGGPMLPDQPAGASFGHRKFLLEEPHRLPPLLGGHDFFWASCWSISRSRVSSATQRLSRAFCASARRNLRRISSGVCGCIIGLRAPLGNRDSYIRWTRFWGADQFQSAPGLATGGNTSAVCTRPQCARLFQSAPGLATGGNAQWVCRTRERLKEFQSAPGLATGGNGAPARVATRAWPFQSAPGLATGGNSVAARGKAVYLRVSIRPRSRDRGKRSGAVSRHGFPKVSIRPRSRDRGKRDGSPAYVER